MTEEERKKYIALKGEQWAVLDGEARAAMLLAATSMWSIGPWAKPRESAKPFGNSARFMCVLYFTLITDRELKPGWHTQDNPKFPSAVTWLYKDRLWGSLLGEYWPVKGFFRSIPCAYFDVDLGEVVYGFEVYKRRMHVLWLEGERGLLDKGQNPGEYWGYLDHVQEQDLDTLGCGEALF